MTQPNQSELVDTILSVLGIVDKSSGNRPEQIATLEQELIAHTNAEIAKVLDRLETHYWLNDDIDTLMCPEIEAFVEAERNRLNPSKSTPFNKLKEVK